MAFLSQSLGSLDPSIGQFTPQLPGPTDLQSASLSGLERLAAGETGVFQDPATLAGLNAITEILGSGPADYMDYFETGIADPAQRDLERALSEVDARAVGSGNLFSSDRVNQQRDISDDFFRDLGEQRSRFGLETLNASTENKLSAMGLLPQMANLEVERGMNLFNIGSQEREMGVQQFEAEQAEFARQEQVKQFIMELIFRAGASPTYGVTGGFPVQGPNDSGGLVGGLFSGISTELLKKDGKSVDSAEVLRRLQSMPVKAWRYLWENGEDGMHIGPYAEDFQRAFGGEDYKIDFLHALGVSMVALQELTSRVEALEEKIGIRVAV
jgi:hypothetical protein